MTTAYLTHPLFFEHRSAGSHPECPERLIAIENRLREDNLFDRLKHYVAPKASVEDVRRVHTTRLIDELEHTAPESGVAYVDPDTYMNESSLDAAWHAAGAAVHATRLVVRGEVSNAFCAVRPPGHHALRDKAMGFCLFNNVVVGAVSALEEHRLDRVAILDFDVHHGNGTEDYCAHDERVLLCSTFQHPFYPFIGADTAKDNIVNVPLESGTGSAAFRKAIQEHWLTALHDFKPQMVFLSAGFDAHKEDQLAHFELEDEDYRWVTQQLMEVTDRYAGGKLVSCLEGGYALGALARSVSLHIRTLAGV